MSLPQVHRGYASKESLFPATIRSFASLMNAKPTLGMVSPYVMQLPTSTGGPHAAMIMRRRFSTYAPGLVDLKLE